MTTIKKWLYEYSHDKRKEIVLCCFMLAMIFIAIFLEGVLGIILLVIALLLLLLYCAKDAFGRYNEETIKENRVVDIMFSDYRNICWIIFFVLSFVGNFLFKNHVFIVGVLSYVIPFVFFKKNVMKLACKHANSIVVK